MRVISITSLYRFVMRKIETPTRTTLKSSTAFRVLSALDIKTIPSVLGSTVFRRIVRNSTLQQLTIRVRSMITCAERKSRQIC